MDPAAYNDDDDVETPPTDNDEELLVETNRSTLSHRICIGLIILLLLALIVSAILFFIFNILPYRRHHHHEHPHVATVGSFPSNTSVGNSTGWKQVAEYFDEAVNLKADPCDDFFEFACGQYSDGQKPPPIHRLGEKLAKDMREAIDAYKVTSNSPRALKQVKMAYEKCLNASTSEVNLTMLLPYIKEFGGWPLVFQKEVINKTWDPYTLMGKLNSLTVQNIFTASFMPNWKDPDQGNMVFIDQAETLIPLAIYQSPLIDEFLKITRNEINFITERFVNALGLDKLNENQLKNDIDLMMLLDYRMAHAGDRGWKSRQNWTKAFNVFDIKTAKEQWPDIEWEQYLKALAGNNIDPEKLVSKSFSIVIPRFMKVLSQLPIRPAQGASVAQNYLIFKFIQKVISVLPEYEEQYRRMKQLELIRTSKLITGPLPSGRKDICTDLLNGLLPFAMSRLYVDYIYKDTGKPINKLNQMSEFMIEGFGYIIKNLKWIDEKTKFEAKEKIVNVVKNIGYPEWIMDDDILDAKHPKSRLHITKHDHIFEVYVKLGRFSAWFDWHKFLEPVNRLSCGNPPTTINAWYQAIYNSITFPLAFMQQPLFDVEFPMTYNFGAIGAIMGHELVHGFDTHGSLFDEIGRLRTWMSKESVRGYTAMTQCLTEQYDNFCYPKYDICIDGPLTLGENIADNGGLASAYTAYKSYVKLNGEEPRLPGNWSDYTMDQIFFLSYGHLWCSSANQDPKYQIFTDSHSPKKWRALGTLRDFPPFAKAFNCKPNSQMAPTKHCNGWWS